MMKKLKMYSRLVILFISLVLVSCSSSDDSDSDSNNPETFIRYTANGTDYEYVDIATVGSLNLTLNGQIGLEEDSDYSFISIWFPLNISEGTYPFSGDFFDDGDYKLNLDSNELDVVSGWSSTGNVTITTISSEYIEGTFTGSVQNGNNETVSIENGEFKAYSLD